KRAVDAGKIGATAVMRFSRCSFQPQKVTDNWFLDQKQSGGMMLDLMIHDFDFARWVGGDVKTVFAKKISSSHSDAIIDHGLAILTHENGTISHIEGSWAYPPPMWRTRFEIAGSNGWLSHDSRDTAVTHLHLHQTDDDVSDVALPNSPLAEDPYTTQIKSFYAHLAHNEPTSVSAADGLAALQIALAAIESAETGQAVAIAANNS
ncbi:MAG: Gfo/Idh/MocA family oxidoreductase, partial [Chloroflexi bacterium]|nr:Gfo/Idh/MocA family oxidoreductase [Chloroflexota bacterium]